MRVLIAYDGSDYAEAALADLHRAGLHDVEALVLSVDEIWLPSGEMLPSDMTDEGRAALTGHREAALTRARRTAERAREYLRQHFPHWRETADAAIGSPLEAIIERADAWQADLVVVGAHGRAAAAGAWPGSVTLGAVRHARGSVRVARHAASGADTAARLILAVDGSAPCHAMLEHVRSRCWPPGTQARVLTVIDTRLEPLVIPGLALGPTSESWAREVADRSARLLRESGLAASAWVERGDPRHVLLNAARDWPADCVFAAARGMTRTGSLPLGSVSTAVALRAPCSVEVVRESMLE